MKDIIKYIVPGICMLILGMGMITSNHNSEVGIYVSPPSAQNYDSQIVEKENGEIGVYAKSEDQDSSIENIHHASGYEEKNKSFFEETKDWFNRKGIS